MKAAEQVIGDVMEQVGKRNPNEPEFRRRFGSFESSNRSLKDIPNLAETGILRE